MRRRVMLVSMMLILLLYSWQAGAQTVAPAAGEADFSSANAIEFVQRPEEDMLIAAVVVGGKYMLDEGIIIYSNESGVMLPLGKMMELFQFQIDVNPSEGHAAGWFMRTDNAFDLAVPYEHVMIDGRKHKIDPKKIETHEDDIYVSQALFDSWFPVTTQFNFNQLRLDITTVLDIAIAECNRFFSTFQLVQVGDAGLQDNIHAAVFETVGEA